MCSKHCENHLECSLKQDCFNIHKQINVPQSLVIIKFTYQRTLCPIEILANDFVSCVSGHPPLVAAIEELTDYDLPEYNYTQSEIYYSNMHRSSPDLDFSSNILRVKEDTALFYFYQRHNPFLLSLIRLFVSLRISVFHHFFSYSSPLRQLQNPGLCGWGQWRGRAK